MSKAEGSRKAVSNATGLATFVKPKPIFLEPGDVVEVEIGRIGTLRNPVQEE